MSQNLAFVRDEAVAGPKTCDDTLSNGVEALFGRKSHKVRTELDVSHEIYCFRT